MDKLEYLQEIHAMVTDIKKDVEALKEVAGIDQVSADDELFGTFDDETLADDEFDETDPEQVLNALTLGVYTLTWRSNSGEKTMQVTLSEEDVPTTEQDALHDAMMDNEGQDRLLVWSPDRSGWRSFYVHDIVDIVPVE